MTKELKIIKDEIDYCESMLFYFKDKRNFMETNKIIVRVLEERKKELEEKFWRF